MDDRERLEMMAQGGDVHAQRKLNRMNVVLEPSLQGVTIIIHNNGLAVSDEDARAVGKAIMRIRRRDLEQTENEERLSRIRDKYIIEQFGVELRRAAMAVLIWACKTQQGVLAFYHGYSRAKLLEWLSVIIEVWRWRHMDAKERA